jgi:hypothetical protein
MKKRLSLLDLHSAELKKNMLGKVKGGIDIRCLCSYNNPLVSTREGGGTSALCFCESSSISTSVQNKPIG